MRVLVAAERLGSGGGMERYLDVVLPALAARGATVHVVARRLGAVLAGVTAERIAWADEHDATSVPARSAVRAALAAFAPDVAVAHNVMDAGIVEALRAARRFVYHVHDHRPFCPNGDRVFPRSGRLCTLPIGRPCAVHSLTDGCAYGPRRRTLTLIRRRERLRDAIGAADAIVVASRYVRERAVTSDIPDDRIVEIAPPLADDSYADQPSSPAAAVAFIGRVVPQKGLRSLVGATALIGAAARPRIVACGDGPDLVPARADAARLGVELDALGAVDAERVRDAIDEAALVVVPSLWGEPFGYAGVEAFARTRTVIAYDTGGVRSWLRHAANGLAVPRGDQAALASAIASLLEDPMRRHALAVQARADAERFRADVVVDGLMRTYERTAPPT